MDMTPSKEYLDDLQKRFRQLVDGEDAPLGPADLFVILKALNDAIALWRPVAGLTLSELSEAIKCGAEQGTDAWAPMLARIQMTPRDFVKAVHAGALDHTRSSGPQTAGAWRLPRADFREALDAYHRSLFVDDTFPNPFSSW